MASPPAAPEPAASAPSAPEPAAAVPGVDRDVLTLAWLARVLERACTDVTLPQYRLLALIVRGEERASTLAGRLALARPTVSATIDTLVERGLLERTTVDTDRRAVRLTITTRGRAAMLAAERAMRDRLDEILAAVDDPALVRAALGQLATGLAASKAGATGASAATPAHA
jgi:DNA-binding MarR family transcriptional regulator